MSGVEPTLKRVLLTLGRYHGHPQKPVSKDPFRLILYEQVAYLVPEVKRREAFRRLQDEVGLTPKAILAAPEDRLLAIARAGGSIGAKLRAERLRRSAEIARDGWRGNLRSALKLPLAKARRALVAFPMIGQGGADRILAITGAYPVFGLDSNGLRVLLRLGWGKEGRSYAAT